MPLNTVQAEGGSQLSDSNTRFLRASDMTKKKKAAPKSGLRDGFEKEFDWWSASKGRSLSYKLAMTVL